MNIYHIISSIDISCGGPSQSLGELALEQAKQNQNVIILTNQSDHPYYSGSLYENLKIVFSRPKTFKSELEKTIQENKPDLLHGHGIWQIEVHQMVQLALKYKIPYIISPRGMLHPWALNHKKWKKKIALWLYQHKDLQKAACIHATAMFEAEYIRKLGFTNPIAVIPNPIEIKPQLPKIKSKKKRVAFIGRFHPIKNIEGLIQAWAKLNAEKEWELVLVGDGKQHYVESLKQLVNDLHIHNVIFVGFLTGLEKENIMQTFDLLVLPSYSENFGMAVGEALQNEIPVIASKGTPWEDLNTYHCGWWVDNDVDTLAQTMQQAILLSDEERQQMGKLGRQLIKEKYSIEIVAQQMLELYEWILKGSKKPGLVWETDHRIEIQKNNGIKLCQPLQKLTFRNTKIS